MGQKKTKIYLVGDENASVTNSWEMMTNDLVAASEKVAEMGGGQIKTIDVPEPRRAKK